MIRTNHFIFKGCDSTHLSNAVLTVSNKPETVSLDLVHRAVRQSFTETSAIKPVLVVWRDVTETR